MSVYVLSCGMSTSTILHPLAPGRPAPPPRPPFATCIRYPHCLFFLDLVQDADFRNAIKDFSYAEHIRQAQDSFFRNFHSNRVAEAEGKATAAPAADGDGGAGDAMD